MNIGTNPTVGGKGLHLEAHLFDFDGDLYDQTLRVSLHKRIRSEQRFENLEDLKNQIESDKTAAISFFKEASLS